MPLKEDSNYQSIRLLKIWRQLCKHTVQEESITTQQSGVLENEGKYCSVVFGVD